MSYENNNMSIWGKVIGGAAGFALGGPLGAMMGVMAGNIYDKKRKITSAHQGIPNQQNNTKRYPVRKSSIYLLLASLHLPQN